MVSQAINLLMLGRGGNGKTHFVQAMTTKTVIKDMKYVATTGIHYSKTIYLDVHTALNPDLTSVELCLIDTESQNKSMWEEFRAFSDQVGNPFKGAHGAIVLGDKESNDTIKHLYDHTANAVVNGMGKNFAVMTEDPDLNAILQQGTKAEGKKKAEEPKTLFPAVFIVNKCDGDLLKKPKLPYKAVTTPYKKKVPWYYMSLHNGKAYTGGYFVRDAPKKYRDLEEVPFTEPLRCILRSVTGCPDLEIVGDAKEELDNLIITTREGAGVAMEEMHK